MKIKYKKFGIIHREFTGNATRVLLTDDHLMFAKKIWYVEKYYRLFYKDIKSFCIYRVVWKNILMRSIYILLSMFFIGLGIYIAISEDIIPAYFLFGLGLLFLLMLFVNLFRGGSATIQITTHAGVKKAKMPSFKKAKKLLKIVSEQVEMYNIND